MYTNGLKDRFGSPLLSKRDGDTLYFDKKSSENLQSDFTSHVGDTTHLTEQEKAALQQLVQGSLTVKEITIIDDNANAISLLSENYEEIEDEGIVLKFEDSLDNNYLMCSEKDLVDATDYLELDVNINCPEELGKKLVRRYLVIDLRNMKDERNIVTIFPEGVRWISQIPVIEANKFYVISFQRFAKDLVIANLEINLAE